MSEIILNNMISYDQSAMFGILKDMYETMATDLETANSDEAGDYH